MFYGDMPEKDSVLMPDIEAAAFKGMLKFLYTDSLSFDSWQEASAVYSVAQKYLLTSLKVYCISEMNKLLSVNNAGLMHSFGLVNEEHGLTEECMKVIVDETTAVITSEYFHDVSIETLSAILDQDVLNVSSELVLFDAIQARISSATNRDEGVSEEECTQAQLISLMKQKVEFLETSLKALGEGPAVTDSALLTDKQKLAVYLFSTLFPIEPVSFVGTQPQLIELMKQKVRFLAMTSQEFAKGPGAKDSTLLTFKEKLALHDCLALSLTEPLPVGFTCNSSARILPLRLIEERLLNTTAELHQCLLQCEPDVEVLKEATPTNTTSTTLISVNKFIGLYKLKVPNQHDGVKYVASDYTVHVIEGNKYISTTHCKTNGKNWCDLIELQPVLLHPGMQYSLLVTPTNTTNTTTTSATTTTTTSTTTRKLRLRSFIPNVSFVTECLVRITCTDLESSSVVHSISYTCL